MPRSGSQCDPLARSQTADNAAASIAPEPGFVGKVKQDWQVREDFAFASKLQDDEFADHYGLNKTERRQIRGDIQLTKEEQKLEDVYAAEFREQQRRDREVEDARLAAELQRQLEEQEARKYRLHSEEEDANLAKALQLAEETHSKADHDALTRDALLAERIQRLELEQRGARPSGAPPTTKPHVVSPHSPTHPREKVPPPRPPPTYVQSRSVIAKPSSAIGAHGARSASIDYDPAENNNNALDLISFDEANAPSSSSGHAGYGQQRSAFGSRRV